MDNLNTNTTEQDSITAELTPSKPEVSPHQSSQNDFTATEEKQKLLNTIKKLRLESKELNSKNKKLEQKINTYGDITPEELSNLLQAYEKLKSDNETDLSKASKQIEAKTHENTALQSSLDKTIKEKEQLLISQEILSSFYTYQGNPASSDFIIFTVSQKAQLSEGSIQYLNDQGELVDCDRIIQDMSKSKKYSMHFNFNKASGSGLNPKESPSPTPVTSAIAGKTLEEFKNLNPIQKLKAARQKKK